MNMVETLKECICEDIGKQWEELTKEEQDRVDLFIESLLEDHWDNYSERFFNEMNDLIETIDDLIETIDEEDGPNITEETTEHIELKEAGNEN